MNRYVITAIAVISGSFCQAKDSTQVRAYIWGSLAPVNSFVTSCGATFHLNKNVFEAGLYKYKEVMSEDFFAPAKPLRVKSSRTYGMSYGCSANITPKVVRLIYTLGFGYTKGTWRTADKRPGGGGGFLSWNNPDYIERDYSGISILPKVEIMALHPRIGFSIGYLQQLLLSRPEYSTHQVYLKLSLGKTR